MNLHLLVGDCTKILPTLLEGEVSSVVTDPPYHLTNDRARAEPTRFGKTRRERGFMNKKWDGGDVAFRPETWATMLPVIRPGGYLLAFGATRTYHRMACAVEDAGWEIVDCLAWMHGQGFPKHDSKLKPAFEPIVLARAPGPVLDLNIDACRIPFRNAADERESKHKNRHADFGSGPRENRHVYGAHLAPRANHDAPGRYPANVMLDETAGALLDQQSGPRRSSRPGTRHKRGVMNAEGNERPSHGEAIALERPGYDDIGGASRFFYCPKASRSERDAGLADLDEQPLHWSSGSKNPGSFQSAGTKKSARNNHPTVKPIALMRWLARLITPSSGTVLDPFMGSGSTGAACGLEGFHFIGTDLHQEYVEIAHKRIIHWRRDELFQANV